MASIIILVGDDAEQWELEVVVVSREEQNKIALVGKLFDVVQYAMWT